MKPLPGQKTMFGEGQSALPQYDAATVRPEKCRLCGGTGRMPSYDGYGWGNGGKTVPCTDCAAPSATLVPLNASVPQDDAARIANQQEAILARLQQGPATGPELLRIAARYSARLGELRDAGKIKGWLKRPIGGGQFEYRLI